MEFSKIEQECLVLVIKERNEPVIFWQSQAQVNLIYDLIIDKKLPALQLLSNDPSLPKYVTIQKLSHGPNIDRKMVEEKGNLDIQIEIPKSTFSDQSTRCMCSLYIKDESI
jgi:hypothetical protein